MIFFVVFHLMLPLQQTQAMGVLQPAPRYGQLQLQTTQWLQAGVPDDGTPELQPALGYGVL